mgnify:CR=1 FL=1|tara:strand:+ start:3916 stop:4023 length:108 start_codon:yes stop_codon:yes gene_type:complete
MGIVTAMVKDLENLEVVKQWKEELDALYAKEDEEE